jgi:hypothetical protein
MYNTSSIPHPLVFWGLNILSFGIYAATDTLVKQHHIKNLTRIQKEHFSQIEGLMNDLNQREKHLINSLKEDDSENINTLSERIQKRAPHQKNLQDNLKFDLTVAKRLSKLALKVIAFIGQLMGNILTLGLYGIYTHHLLRKHICLLEVQNENRQNRLNQWQEEQYQYFQQIIEHCSYYMTLKREHQILQKTDGVKMYGELKEARNQLVHLQKRQDQLHTEITALRTQKLVVEQDLQKSQTLLHQKEDEIYQLYLKFDLLGEKQRELNYKYIILGKENAQKAKELTEKRRESVNLQTALDGLQAKTQALERQITYLQTTLKNQPYLIQLGSQIGPLPPKYHPLPGTPLLIAGTMDLQEMRNHLDSQQIAFAEEYNQRYGDKQTAAEVIAAGFQYAFDQLIKMAEENDLIRLNRSEETAATPGAYAVYRYMILDILSGAKVDSNFCSGYLLRINENVSMLPSSPEKIIQRKGDEKNGWTEVIQLRYKQRDDFTPSEETLRLRDGVNAVAAKWILEQLTQEERDYLFLDLMKPVIVQKKNLRHPHYVKMRRLMKKLPAERRNLVQLASEHIQDLGTAIQFKFGQTVLSTCWKKHANDKNLDPFVNPEENETGLDKIPNVQSNQTADIKREKWEIDEQVLSNRGSQTGFCDLIKKSRENYQKLFQHLDFDENLLASREKPGREFNRLSWESARQQYHVTHQMIGANFEGQGGVRCLFSNLLAILVTDKKDITLENVKDLRKAMAAYLDKLQSAQATWQSKATPDLKKWAELASAFKETIKITHDCTVEEYQAWLRNDERASGKARNIDIGNLTQFEIQLAAYTIGVRIGLLYIHMSQEGISQVDEYGRILPGAEMYGSNTKEILLMGISDHGRRGGGATYYGLFPKLQIENNELLQLNPEAFNAALTLQSYWASIPHTS